MFDNRNFIACIEGQLAERGFGATRKAEIVDRFNGLTESFQSQGYGSQIAGTMAMSRVFEELATVTRERAKRALKTLEVQAVNQERIALGRDVTASSWIMDGARGRGGGLVRAAIALIQNDPRFPGISVETIRDSYRGKYWAVLADGLDRFGKGAFGTQKGQAGLWDIVREIFGRDTGNADAKAFAQSYLKLDDIMVTDRNNAGASLQKLETFFLPQRQNPASILGVSKQQWIDDHGKWLDWDKMRWPDGGTIDPKDRLDILDNVYATLTTDGKIKIDPAKFSGRGASVGNSLEDHRFMVFKDADAWIQMHEKYGDGNVFDVISSHVEGMAHKTALVQQFGPNPSLAIDNIRAIVLREAAKVVQAAKAKGDVSAVVEAEKGLKNRLVPMFEQYTRANAMSADSPFAAGVVATSNILTAAKLGSVPLLAVAGDFHQTLSVRMLNNLPLMDGISTYLKGVTTDFKGSQRLAVRSGFVFDNAVGATYTTERFSPVATYGPQFSRRLSDNMIRASGLSRHTEIARWTAQHELMGVLNDNIKTEFDKLPFANMLERYGIDKDMWDTARKSITPWTPEPGAEFFRPLDLLDTKVVNKDELYRRFFSMIEQESKHMVPGSTLEASVILRGTSRPDTLPGAILHSFAMYKNFPITFIQMYGRLAMSEERTSSRLGFIAAIGVGSILVGALGTQLREISKGRAPLPMDRATFWGKAALSGGAMSIWGDFLTSGVNQFGQGPYQVAAGPTIGVIGDMANVVLGDPFKFVSAFDKEDEFKSTFAARLATFAKQNTPGTSIWWARLALERQVWDVLDELADPHAHRKQQARMRKQLREQGNTYFSEPGTRLIGNY